MKDDHLIDLWFELRDEMLTRVEAASATRPPSLRDAAYAYTISVRSQNDINPQAIEAYVNGLEIGAMAALREAWGKYGKGG